MVEKAPLTLTAKFHHSLRDGPDMWILRDCPLGCNMITLGVPRGDKTTAMDIVHCVNTHDQAQARIRELEAALREIEGLFPGYGMGSPVPRARKIAEEALSSSPPAPVNGESAPWSVCKIAFASEVDDPNTLWEAFDRRDSGLPIGWTLTETDCSGARDPIAIFDVYGVLPTVADGLKVQALIVALSKREVK